MWQVLERVTDRSLLIEREQFWIDKLNAYSQGYNTSPTAGNTAGRVCSPETKAKISASLKGKPAPKPEGHGANVSKALKGKPKSAEHREALRQANLGYKQTPEHVARMIEGKRRARESKSN